MTILRRFFSDFADYRVVFSAGPFSGPKPTLAPTDPPATSAERHLSSGMFLGYAPEILKILELGDSVKDEDDDELFYTNVYLDLEKRVRGMFGGG